MGLDKQTAEFYFGRGLALKDDPFKIPAGKFLSLQNTIFDTLTLLKKRNGFGLKTNTIGSISYLTTFQNNLIGLGSSIQTYSTALNQFVYKGAFPNVQINVVPLSNNFFGQPYTDTAISSNGLICQVAVNGVSNPISANWTIFEQASGQAISGPNNIVSSGGPQTFPPRVFAVGSQFVVLFNANINQVTAASSSFLEYITIPTGNPFSASSVNVISSNFAASAVSNTGPLRSSLSFDAVTVSTSGLYVVWTNVLNAQPQSTLLNPVNNTQTPIVTFGLTGADALTVAADYTTTPYTMWTAAWVVNTGGVSYSANTPSGGFLANALRVNGAGSIVISSSTFRIQNVAMTAQNGSMTAYVELANSYGYDDTLKTNLIYKQSMGNTGSGSIAVTQALQLVRGLGLASKGFIFNSSSFVLGTYTSPFQSTYFLINSSGLVQAKIAYGNGNPNYLSQGLPNVSVVGSSAYVPYLIQNTIQGINKSFGSQTAVYASLGVNLAQFNFDSPITPCVDIGQNLLTPGGFLGGYDGQQFTENNFFLGPDNVEFSLPAFPPIGSMTPQQYWYSATYEWTDNKGNIFRSLPSIPSQFNILQAPASFTANVTNGSAVLGTVSSLLNLQVGQGLAGITIPPLTNIKSFGPGNTITMTNIIGSGLSTVETITPLSIASVVVNVPTLRLSYKNYPYGGNPKTPARINIYRYSTGQPLYYNSIDFIQDGTVSSTDYQSFVDTNSDAVIAGSINGGPGTTILYTNGGTVEDVNGPATNAITTFDDRLWTISAEDKNVLNFSKQVIENTPVEMSDLFTFYVAPNVGAEGPTGDMQAIAPMDDKLIIFKASAMYYINGVGPDNTGANNQYSQPIFISSAVGCSNPNSIVLISNGLIFQSNKGIWLLGRDLSTNYIGKDVEGIANNAIVLSAITIPNTNQVRFTLNTGITLVYDYFVNEWGTFNGIAGISSTLYQGLHTYVNSSSSVFQETPGLYQDGTSPTLMSFQTGWLNLANLQGYQRAYKSYLLGSYYSPHNFSLGVAYDYNPAILQTITVNPTNTTGSGSQVEQWELNFEKQQCQSFQLTFNEISSQSAGQGLTISGLDLEYGVKKAYPRNIGSANRTS